MKKLFSILLLAVLLSNCKEKEDNQPVAEKVYFSGLTQTDINGWPITVDSTDWRTNDTWVKQESDLFSNVYQTVCIQSYINQIIAYPNPCYGMLSLAFDKLNSTRIEMRIVDENMKPIFSSDSITTKVIMIDGMALGIKDTVRIYYKFIENNCEFRGHGDILIK